MPFRADATRILVSGLHFTSPNVFASGSCCLMNSIMHLSKVKPSKSYLQGQIALYSTFQGQETASLESSECLQQVLCPFFCSNFFSCGFSTLVIALWHCYLLYRQEWLFKVTFPKLISHLNNFSQNQ